MMLDKVIRDMMVENYSNEHGITTQEARKKISGMSFFEYHKLSEASATITPPSGQTIAPSGSSGPGSSTPAGSNIKSIWPGKGSPVEVGMTVGLKGPNGLPIPGKVSQVDLSAKGVKITDPTTGQDQWANIDNLEPFNAQANQTVQPNQPTAENADLVRLKELAGIKEDASCGATGAGAIAMAPTAMGKVKRRQETDEGMLKKEYTPKEAAKTIVGDTKPNQASGQLSANLAATGLKTASRINNGRKRR